MYSNIKTNFKQGTKSYDYYSIADHVVVRDHSKYGSPVVEYLTEGGIYETLKGNHKTKEIADALKFLSRRSDDLNLASLVSELRG